MLIDSVESLLQAIRRVQILAPEQVDEVALELGGLYTEPEALAEYLVQIEWLTPFQCEMLFAGSWDALNIGPYQILGRLGEGGVSEVFQAWDTVRGRSVAVKVLRQDLVSPTDAIQQFDRELQAVTRLNHPNIIKTFDASQIGAMHYFAMEYVEGTDLQKFIQQHGPLPFDQASDYTRQVAQGLQHAHQLGLVHRDIKPANLFLINAPLNPLLATPSRRGVEPLIKILDWGLARILPTAEEAAAAAASGVKDADQGQLIGTADYLAPEQAQDASLVDTRSDIYSLGCTFYFLLTGQPPFPGPSLMHKLMQHREMEPPDVRAVRSDVPDEVAAIIQKMLAKSPEERFQIPLLVVAPLRRYCPGAMVTAGSVIRPPSTNNLGTMLRPSSSGNLSRPSSSGNLNRPSSSGNLRRPSSSPNLGNGYRPGGPNGAGGNGTPPRK